MYIKGTIARKINGTRTGLYKAHFQAIFNFIRSEFFCPL